MIEAFEAPAQHPGCSGSRGLQDNLSDLKAQIAANQVRTNFGYVEKAVDRTPLW